MPHDRKSDSDRHESLFGPRARVAGVAAFGIGGAVAVRAGGRPGLAAFCAVTAALVTMIGIAWVAGRSRDRARTNRGGRGGHRGSP